MQRIDVEPHNMGYYTARLKQFIPKEAYKPASYKLLPMFLHVLLVSSLFLVIRYYVDSILGLLALSVIIGFSYACIFLFAHELTHGIIIRKQPIKYILELFFWSFSGIPPTLWTKLHNHSHHRYMNNLKDPDRKTFSSERNSLNYLYNLMIYPNKRFRYSLTVGLGMMFYTSKHLLTVFYKGASKSQIVTFKPNYSKREKRIIALEFLYIFCFQMFLFFLLGFKKYLIVSLVSWCIYSASVILLIITQHLQNPVFKVAADPLLTTTSVVIPKWLDRIIDWHSFHVEHHVFPGLNFDYYPLLSKHLQELFPERYQRVEFLKALKDSFSQDIFAEDPLV